MHYLSCGKNNPANLKGSVQYLHAINFENYRQEETDFENISYYGGFRLEIDSGWVEARLKSPKLKITFIAT